jgi:hypothetical protein
MWISQKNRKVIHIVDRYAYLYTFLLGNLEIIWSLITKASVY